MSSLLLGPRGAAVDGDAGLSVAIGERFAIVLVLAAVTFVRPIAVAAAAPCRPVAETFFH